MAGKPNGNGKAATEATLEKILDAVTANTKSNEGLARKRGEARDPAGDLLDRLHRANPS